MEDSIPYDLFGCIPEMVEKEVERIFGNRHGEPISIKLNVFSQSDWPLIVKVAIEFEDGAGFSFCIDRKGNKLSFD